MQLLSGVAISPDDAARCILDERRTAVFRAGVRDALAAARVRFAGHPLEVVYAGCGPLAPLLLPFMAHDLRVTFLDVHAESIASVAAILERRGLRGVTALADATTWIHPRPIHIVVAEAMQRALTVEPQVAIVRNLAPQLAPGGILVPERVNVDLIVADPRHTAHRVYAGRVFELTTTPDAPRTLTLPPVPPAHCPMYATTIDVFGPHRLREYDSGLTHPELVWDLAAHAGARLVFRYEIGARPGVRWEVTRGSRRR